MFEGFLNPALAAGAALCAVPLLIHILNRRRHRPLAWGAMRFVLAAHRRTRRRTQLENLLLLFLRMGAVVLLALALARPFTDGFGPLVGLTETRRDVVLVIDASASVGYRENTSTVYERLVDRAREILIGLDAERGDRARLYLGRSYAERLSLSSPDEAVALLGVLGEPTPESFDLTAALAEVVRLAEEDAAGTGVSALEVRLLTDLQRSSFQGRGLVDTLAGGSSAPQPEADPSAPSTGTDRPTGSGTPERPEALAHLDRLAELGVQVVVEDLGPAAAIPANLGVTEVGALGPVFGAGSTVDVGVEVTNWGSSPANGVRVALTVDGVRQPIRIVDIPARDSARAVFPVIFRDAGERVLAAELEGDRLPFDDRRAHVLLVPPPIEVLLVGGSPGAPFEEDELSYVRAVLEPLAGSSGDQPGDPTSLGGVAPPFRTRELLASELDSPAARLDEADVIVLANVPSLSQRATLALEERVAAGAALLVSLGDRVDAEAYNSRLWRADGSGLLPAQLGRRSAVADRRESWFRMGEFEQEHPALAFFSDERWRPLLTEVPVYEFIRSTALADARVLARYDDEGGSPALLERAYDRGVVLLLTTTLDADWTRLPESPRTLIPLLHELLRNASSPSTRAPNLGLSGPLVAETASFPRQPELVSPSGARRPIDGEPESLGGGLWRLPTVEGPFEPGVWRVEYDGGRHALEYAVRAPVLEGDLSRAAASEVDALHPALSVTGPEAERTEESAGTPRGELWRWLAGLCLAFLVAETVWAAWLGHGRRRVTT